MKSDNSNLINSGQIHQFPVYRIDADDLKRVRKIIDNTLRPLVNCDYAYVGLPYHNNIGDTLIWQGTLEFLESLPYKCVDSIGESCFRQLKNISSDTIILMQGGGNFGDLYPVSHNLRHKIIELYPRNPIIILPQSIYYENVENMIRDVKFYSAYPNVTICARDSVSYKILKDNFVNNQVLLLPDMALYINPSPWMTRYGSTAKGKILFARRTDREVSDNIDNVTIPSEAEVHDWPTFENRDLSLIDRYNNRLLWRDRIKRYFRLDLHKLMIDRFWKKKMRPYYVDMGMKFVSRYDDVYSTRLHIAIAAALMGKDVYLVDNCYHKAQNLFSTWFDAK